MSLSLRTIFDVNLFLEAAITLFVIMDPPGTVPGSQLSHCCMSAATPSRSNSICEASRPSPSPSQYASEPPPWSHGRETPSAPDPQSQRRGPVGSCS